MKSMWVFVYKICLFGNKRLEINTYKGAINKSKLFDLSEKYMYSSLDIIREVY